jgi:hypothetical protein
VQVNVTEIGDEAFTDMKIHASNLMGIKVLSPVRV